MLHALFKTTLPAKTYTPPRGKCVPRWNLSITRIITLVEEAALFLSPSNGQGNCTLYSFVLLRLFKPMRWWSGTALCCTAGMRVGNGKTHEIPALIGIAIAITIVVAAVLSCSLYYGPYVRTQYSRVHNHLLALAIDVSMSFLHRAALCTCVRVRIRLLSHAHYSIWRARALCLQPAARCTKSCMLTC